MASAQIVINGTAGSRQDLNIGDAVTLTNFDNSGASVWLWEFLDVPPGSTATITGSDTNTGTFTIDKGDGSYNIRLTVNGTITDQQYAAVLTQHLQNRIPAAKETIQADAVKGWAKNTNIDLVALEKDQRIVNH